MGLDAPRAPLPNETNNVLVLEDVKFRVAANFLLERPKRSGDQSERFLLFLQKICPKEMELCLTESSSICPIIEYLGF